MGRFGHHDGESKDWKWYFDSGKIIKNQNFQMSPKTFLWCLETSPVSPGALWDAYPLFRTVWGVPLMNSRCIIFSSPDSFFTHISTFRADRLSLISGPDRRWAPTHFRANKSYSRGPNCPAVFFFLMQLALGQEFNVCVVVPCSRQLSSAIIPIHSANGYLLDYRGGRAYYFMWCRVGCLPNCQDDTCK